ncbi:MAG: PTS fructose transporter subunit IIA [Rhodocyclaceae bacterium]|nr:PTS fructose transporter subunit IIA [Rhodocyclaceae bacterium]
MIGLLLITHGICGESLFECVRHVQGDTPEQMACLGVCASDNLDEVVVRARELRDSVESGEGVLVLTDIAGASPANVALKLLGCAQTACVAGVNLPMLLRTLTYRHLKLADLVAKAKAGGREGVQEMESVKCD